jgi:hypothetical protein
MEHIFKNKIYVYIIMSNIIMSKLNGRSVHINQGSAGIVNDVTPEDDYKTCMSGFHNDDKFDTSLCKGVERDIITKANKDYKTCLEKCNYNKVLTYKTSLK